MKISFGEAFILGFLTYALGNGIYKHHKYYKPLCGEQTTETCRILEHKSFIYKIEQANDRITKIEEYNKKDLEDCLRIIIRKDYKTEI